MSEEVKQLDRLTPANTIEIWAPKYKTNTVLLAKHKIGTHNEIIFTKAPHLGDNHFYISGDKARSYPTVTNGKLACYDVDMNALQILERK